MTPSNIVTGALAATNNNTLAQVSGASGLELVGFAETLQELQTKCPTFKDVMKAENFMYVATAATALANEVEGGLTASTAGAGLVGATSVISNMKQLYDFYIKTMDLSSLQNKFVEILPGAQLADCAPFPFIAAKTRNETIAFNLDKAKTVTVTLVDRQFFTLNSMPFAKLLGGSVMSFSLSVVCAWFYYQSTLSAPQDGLEMDKPLTEWLSIAGASLPLTKFYESMANLVLGHTAKLFDAISKTVMSYGANIHSIPDNLLQLAEFFMKDEYKFKNRLAIQAAKSELSLGVIKTEVGLLKDEVTALKRASGVSSNQAILFSSKGQNASGTTPVLTTSSTDTAFNALSIGEEDSGQGEETKETDLLIAKPSP